jgi:hypothetical protein
MIWASSESPVFAGFFHCKSATLDWADLDLERTRIGMIYLHQIVVHVLAWPVSLGYTGFLHVVELVL